MPITEKSAFRLRVELDEKVKVEVVERESENVVATKEYDPAELPDAIRPKVELYGLSKLLQDRSSDTDSGPEKLDAMTEVYEMLKGGQWEKERKTGAPVVSAEVEALAELKGITVAQAQSALRKYTKEQRDKILSNAAIVEKAKAIRASRETAEVDLGDLV